MDFRFRYHAVLRAASCALPGHDRLCGGTGLLIIWKFHDITPIRTSDVSTSFRKQMWIAQNGVRTTLLRNYRIWYLPNINYLEICCVCFGEWWHVWGKFLVSGTTSKKAKVTWRTHLDQIWHRFLPQTELLPDNNNL